MIEYEELQGQGGEIRAGLHHPAQAIQPPRPSERLKESCPWATGAGLTVWQGKPVDERTAPQIRRFDCVEKQACWQSGRP